MKVKKPGKGLKRLIEILVDIYDDDDGAVKKIQGELLGFNGGEEKDPELIFGNWANPEPGDDVGRKIVKKVCAIIKDEMFE